VNEQEIRAKALEIAVLNTGIGFFTVKNGIIEFDGNRLDYLNAIAIYLKDNNFREVSNIAERKLQ